MLPSVGGAAASGVGDAHDPVLDGLMMGGGGVGGRFGDGVSPPPDAVPSGSYDDGGHDTESYASGDEYEDDEGGDDDEDYEDEGEEEDQLFKNVASALAPPRVKEEAPAAAKRGTPRGRPPAAGRGKQGRGAAAGRGGGKKSPKPPSASSARNDETWNLRHSQLRQYYAENGDFAVPRKYDPNPQLGYWVNAQRKQVMFFVRGQPSTLTPERMGKLFDMGFPLPKMSINPNPTLNKPVIVPGAGDVWTTRLNELREYRLENGDHQVPRKYDKNPQLGYWVNAQRKQFAFFIKGKKSTLTQPRMRALYNIGFPFHVPKRAPPPVAPAATPAAAGGGGAGTPTSAAKSGGGGTAAAGGRTRGRRPAGGASSAATAPDVGGRVATGAEAEAEATPSPDAVVSTDPPGGGGQANDAEESWRRRLEELRQYRAEHGHASVPQQQGGLSEWVLRQRAQYQNLARGQPSTLTLEKIRALQESGFAFMAQDGSVGRNASPAPSTASGRSAATDATGSTAASSRKRQPATKGKGAKGKKGAKPMSASAARNQDTWNLRLEQLREYHATNGDFAVPQKYPPNPSLGFWVNAQRKQITLWIKGRPNSLTPERMGALYDLGFPLPRLTTNPTPELNKVVSVPGAGDSWNLRLNELREYRLEHGDYAVPQKYPKNPPLGFWVNAQRKQFSLYVKGKKSTLTQARMRALYNIGYPFAIPKRTGGAPAARGRASPKPAGGGAVAVGTMAPNAADAQSQGSFPTEASVSPAVKAEEDDGHDTESYPSEEEGDYEDDEGEEEEEEEEYDEEIPVDPDAIVSGYGQEEVAPAAPPQPTLSPAPLSSSPALSSGRASTPQSRSTGKGCKGAKGKKGAKPLTAAASRNQETWDLRLAQLREYHAENGDYAVPQKYPPNPKLGIWVKAQRQQIVHWFRGKPSSLTQERMGALFSMGFPLPKMASNPNPQLHATVDVHGAGDAWLLRLNELREYRLVYGDYSVPQKYKQNPKLGVWVKALRQQFTHFCRGKKTSLNQARMRALYKIGYVFSVPKSSGGGGGGPRSVAPSSGDTAVAAQMTHVKSEPRPSDPQEVDDDNVQSLPSQSPAEEDYAAEDPTNVFSDQEEDNVGTGEKFGPETSAVENGPDLAAAAIVLPPAALQGFAGSVGPDESAMAADNQEDGAWMQRFAELRRFREENGHCLVPLEYESNRELGAWVSEQRAQYRHWIDGDVSSLTSVKIRALKEIGFAFDERAVFASASTIDLGSRKRDYDTPGAEGSAEKRGRTTDLLPDDDAPGFVSPLSSKNLDSAFQGSPAILESTAAGCDGEGESDELVRVQQARINIMKGIEEMKAQLKMARSQLEETRHKNEVLRTQLTLAKGTVRDIMSKIIV